MAQLSVGQRVSSEAIHACKRRVPGASSAASKLRIGQGLRTERVRSWHNSPRCICSRCRNFSTHFDWRRLAVSSSVFGHGTSASGVFRTSFTELERNTDPDDEGIVVPSQAVSGFPRCGAPRGANPISSPGATSPYSSPAGPVPLGHHPPASHAVLSLVQTTASATGGCAKHFLHVCVTVFGHRPRE